MEIGIIGLPQSGKTTLFNSLTKGKAELHAYAPTSLEPNLGVAKVADPRLAGLEAMLQPKRTVPAEVKYIDVAIPKGSGKGLSGELLSYLSNVDAFIQVVRAFSDESIPHSEGSIDPARDVGIINLELVFADLVLLDKRLLRIGDSLKGAKSPERENLLREQALISRIKDNLEKEVPFREQSLTKEEARLMESYNFLTAKPPLVVLNIGEEQLLFAIFLLPICSIGWQKSHPVTGPSRENTSERSPVPQPTSRTLGCGTTIFFSTSCTQILLHRRSRFAERKWFRKS